MRAILLFFVAIMALAAGWTNFAYPEINREFVRHTFLMDTIFDTRMRRRAITSPTIHNLAHWAITAAEFACGLLCLAGAILYLAKSVYARTVATIGLVVGIAIWFGGFRGVAGEWFGMWQSREWNGLPDGERIALALLAILNVVNNFKGEYLWQPKIM